MAEQTFRSPGFFEREIDLTGRVVEPTGTPAGIGSISEEDLLEGYLMGKKAFSVKIK